LEDTKKAGETKARCCAAAGQSSAHRRPRFPDVVGEKGERTHAIDVGGIGAVHQVGVGLGLVSEIDDSLELLKAHLPHHESDHVLNIAYNSVCGGQVLQDIELRRNDPTYLDALGTESIPDPTTAGDFCRRFEAPDIDDLQDAINRRQLKAWQQQPPSFF
jgi:hypothetical protein